MQAETAVTDPETGKKGDTLQELLQRVSLTPLTALTLFSFACISMGGFMFSHSISIDDELALFADNYWGIALQGRFVIGAYSALAQGVVPLLPHLLLACGYVIAYSFILLCHGLSHNWKTHLGYLVFILFPVNWLNQEFSGLAGALAFGLPAACWAAYCTLQRQKQTLHSAPWRRVSLSAIGLLLIAISAYQSLLTLYLAICLGQLLFNDSSLQQRASQAAGSGQEKRQPNSTIRSSLLLYISTALLAAAIQSLSLKAFLAISDQQVSHINIYFRSPYFMLRTQPLQYIGGNIEQLWKTYLQPGLFYGHNLTSFTGLLILAILLMVYSQKRSRSQGQQASNHREALATAALLLLAPLALNLISAPYRLPMRSFLALPYIAFLGAVICLELSSQRPLNRFQPLALGLSVFLVVQSLVIVSHYYGARAFSYRSDQLVATTIASSIIRSDSSQQAAVHRIATRGSLARSVPYRTGWYSTAASSFFNWDNGSPARIVSWLKAMGIEGITAVEKEEDKAFDSEFAGMKAWPQPGSIKVKNGTLLLKLSAN